MICPPDGFRGVIRGKTIELEQQPHLPDGQVVSVIVSPVRATGDSLRRAFGGWAAESADLEEYLAQMHELRRHDRRWALP